MIRISLMALLALLLAGAGYFYLSAAQQDAPGAEADSASFEGFDLTVQPQDGACWLRYSDGRDSGQVALSVPPPCRFMRDSDGGLQRYAEGERQLITVVGGTPEKNPIDPLTERPDCGTAVAGIVFSTGKFATTAYSMGPGVYCAKMGLDQRDQWLFLNG